MFLLLQRLGPQPRLNTFRSNCFEELVLAQYLRQPPLKLLNRYTQGFETTLPQCCSAVKAPDTTHFVVALLQSLIS